MIQISETRNAVLLATLNKEIQGLHHKLYPDKFKPYEKAAIEDAFEAMVAQENVKAFVACRKGEAAGYVLVILQEIAENPFQQSRKFPLVDQLMVLKEHRGNGIGKSCWNMRYPLPRKKMCWPCNWTTGPTTMKPALSLKSMDLVIAGKQWKGN